MDLGRYKWYQSQTLDDVPVRTLGLKGGEFGDGPTSIKGMSASEDAGPRRGWIVMSHIGWGGEQIAIYKGVKTFL